MAARKWPIWSRRTVAAVNAPEKPHDLPLDVHGTAFQEAVWRELQPDPAGRDAAPTPQIAAAVGRPAAVRAAGTANGANNVAVLIPCHRVIRTDGTPGGYAYGLERKAKLLAKGRLGRQSGLDLVVAAAAARLGFRRHRPAVRWAAAAGSAAMSRCWSARMVRASASAVQALTSTSRR